MTLQATITVNGWEHDADDPDHNLRGVIKYGPCERKELLAWVEQSGDEWTYTIPGRKPRPDIDPTFATPEEAKAAVDREFGIDVK